MFLVLVLFLVSVQKCFCSYAGGKVHLSEQQFVSKITAKVVRYIFLSENYRKV